MTLLEIISARRNLDFKEQDSKERDLEEVRRASIVGLSCIEQDEEVRPNMGQVVLMLEGKMHPQIQQIRSSANMDKQADSSEIDSDSDGEVIR
ncbi:hypothetical protein SUGI_0663050 [Cryptomeria japonica]|nr:hypothetical protein SUGI_0663050 [Cryptomeria japonica]